MMSLPSRRTRNVSGSNAMRSCSLGICLTHTAIRMDPPRSVGVMRGHRRREGDAGRPPLVDRRSLPSAKLAIVYEEHRDLDPDPDLAVHSGVPNVAIGHDRGGEQVGPVIRPRGHRGSLLLRCGTLSFLSPCRIIPALQESSFGAWMAISAPTGPESMCTTRRLMVCITHCPGLSPIGVDASADQFESCTPHAELEGLPTGNERRDRESGALHSIR